MTENHQTIKHYYRNLIKIVHPDKLPQNATHEQIVIANHIFDAITIAIKNLILENHIN